MSAVADLMQEDLSQSPPPRLGGLLFELESRYGDQLQAVLLYGSCRRDQDVGDGLVDLLVLVKDYPGVHGYHPSVLLNRMLPPNVYYLHSDEEDGAVRCKYALITLAQFARRCRSRSDHYFWARFTQPCRLLFARKGAGLDHLLAEIRATAAREYCARIAPLLTAPMDAAGFWQLALATTYRCELRPEPPGNARRLIATDPAFWAALTRTLAEEHEHGLIAQDGLFFRSGGAGARLLARLNWLLRRVSGKAFNLARLFKAAGTFSNGIDYIAWKVERHSGVRFEPTERMRRYPRLAAWGLAWRMWRQGGFR